MQPIINITTSNPTLFEISYFDFIARLAVAVLCGLLVGFERKWINRVAGVQTNALVAAGAAIFVMGSYFVSYEGQSASRIAAQIVSGIGFLGAGMIFREGFTTHGINTAATIWSSAAIGILCGMGLIPYALIAAFFLILANTAFRKIDHIITNNRKWNDNRVFKEFEIQILAPKHQSKEIRSKAISLINIEDHKIFSVKTNIENKEFMKIKISFKTQHLHHKNVQEACEKIEDFVNSLTQNKESIVDWSELK